MLEEQNTKSNKSNDWKQRELGAFWTKDGPKGKYLSGTLEIDELGHKKKVAVVMFPNRYKESDRQPDYVLYSSKENNNSPTESTNKAEVNTKKEEIPDSLV